MERTTYKRYIHTDDNQLLALDVCYVGYQQARQGQRWGPGIRDYYIIHYVAQGKGSYTFDGVSREVSAGESFLTFPDTIFSYCADETDPWEFYSVGFNGTGAKALLSQTPFTKHNPVVPGSFGGRLQQLLVDIYEEQGTRPSDTARMVGKLYFIFSMFMDLVSTPGKNELLDEHIAQSTKFVAANFSEPITVDDIAASINLSRSQLFRIYKKRFGISPIEYLTRYRISYACSLLQKTDYSVSMVATSVGFSDPFYFSKVFKQITGVSPSRYGKETVSVGSSRSQL